VRKVSGDTGKLDRERAYPTDFVALTDADIFPR